MANHRPLCGQIGLFSDSCYMASGFGGGIEGDLWDHHHYDYGTFRYRQTLVDKDSDKAFTFIVLNYWVE